MQACVDLPRDSGGGTPPRIRVPESLLHTVEQVEWNKFLVSFGGHSFKVTINAMDQFWEVDGEEGCTYVKALIHVANSITGG